jgi:uncharacterized membrane protein YraQ (UPF0718 family)
VLVVLMGWQFTAAEFVGGPLMIVFVALLFRAFLTPKARRSSTQQAERGLAGRMKGHAEMDMSVTDGSLFQRLTAPKGFTAVSHYCVMNWASVWADIAIGLLAAGALAAWVPNHFWQSFFLVHHRLAAKIEGPLVAVTSFVCSVGNVPLAAVLWNGGISFGGVASFIFADLIVLPVVAIYRKYYGTRVMLFIAATFRVAMVAAGYIVEIVFGALGLVPSTRHAKIVDAHVTLNGDTGLNVIFLAITAALVIRFVKTGGLDMLKMMNRASGHSEHLSARPGLGTQPRLVTGGPRAPPTLERLPSRP